MELDDTLVRVSQKHIINLGYLIEVADNTCHFYPPFEKLDDVKVGRFFRKKLIDRFSSF
jgi:two-component system, LytTR family, response regulator